MKKFLIYAGAILFVIILLSRAGGDSKTVNRITEAKNKTVQLTGNDPAVSGTAELIEYEGGVSVTVEMPTSSEENFAVRLYSGTCQEWGKGLYNLQPLESGFSGSEIPGTTIAELSASPVVLIVGRPAGGSSMTKILCGSL